MPAEVHAIEQGTQIARLLPSEQVLLVDPDLEIVVLERIASRRVAQYAVRGDERASRGPLVIALDESGSMHAARNEWAKAAAVALSRVAFAERRSVSVVHYATSVVVQPLRDRDADALLHMIRHFLGGGTAIGLALSAAVDEVKSHERRGARGADIVLITDGVDEDVTAQSEAVATASARDVRIWTIAIECDIAASSPLRAQAAGYTRLGSEDLSDHRAILRAGYGGRG